VVDRVADVWLICRVQTRLCALPLDHVIETLRPLPVEPVAGAPPFVLGLTVIRGVPLPVVDVARLLGADGAKTERFVTAMAGNRRVVLAVDHVLGVRTVAPQSLHALPSLLHTADVDVISAIGLLDAELLLVLRSARLLPEDAMPPPAGVRHERVDRP
jgi:purine-binding chemotaxis protein CheW